jgi:hypothetical protein
MRNYFFRPNYLKKQTNSPNEKGINRPRLAGIFGVAKSSADRCLVDGCPILKRPAGKGDPWPWPRGGEGGSGR